MFIKLMRSFPQQILRLGPQYGSYSSAGVHAIISMSEFLMSVDMRM